MRIPSRSIKYHMNKLVGDRDYMNGLAKDLEQAQAVKAGMDSKFGAALYMALEAIERDAYRAIIDTNPINIFKHYKLQAELKTATYIKNRLDSHIVNVDALVRNMEELQSEGED